MNWFGNRLVQSALYWEPPDRDGYGNYKWGSPFELRSRWKDSGRAIRYDKTGSEVVSSSVVWVDTKTILVGGYLMLGDLYSIERLTSPPLEEYYVIEEGKKLSQEYARQIIDVESINSVYSLNVYTTKVWLK